MSPQDPAKPAVSARSAQGALSRERILDAAVELIAERGYSATSVDSLCRKAGIVKTALYWHFGSKEGLLAAALDRVSTEWIEEVRSTVYQTGRPMERLERMLNGMRDILTRRPRHMRMLLSVLLERSEGDPETRQAIQKIFARAIDAMVAGINYSVGRPVPDADLLAHTILALTQGTALRSLVDPGAIDLDRYFADIRRTIILVMADRLRQMGLVAETAPPGTGGDAG